MDDVEPGAGGVSASLRRIGSSLAALLRARTELLGVELQEEKLRVLNLLVWAGIALALAAAGILLVVGILAFYLWQQFGYPGVIALAAVVLAGAWVLLRILRRRLEQEPAPFATTIAEIGKDLECLRTRE